MLRAPACCHGVPSWGPGCVRPPQKPAWVLGCAVVLWCRGAWLERSDGEKCRAGLGNFSSWGYFWTVCTRRAGKGGKEAPRLRNPSKPCPGEVGPQLESASGLLLPAPGHPRWVAWAPPALPALTPGPPVGIRRCFFPQLEESRWKPSARPQPAGPASPGPAGCQLGHPERTGRCCGCRGRILQHGAVLLCHTKLHRAMPACPVSFWPRGCA